MEMQLQYLSCLGLVMQSERWERDNIADFFSRFHDLQGHHFFPQHRDFLLLLLLFFMKKMDVVDCCKDKTQKRISQGFFFCPHPGQIFQDVQYLENRLTYTALFLILLLYRNLNTCWDSWAEQLSVLSQPSQEAAFKLKYMHYDLHFLNTDHTFWVSEIK